MKRKIGIITHYAVHNHGAQLQLYALITVFRLKGYDVHALQFDKDYCYMSKDAKNKYRISINSIPYYTKYILTKGIKKTLFNIRKKKIFDTFRSCHDILGDKYENFAGDLAIVGSDEVFSFETGVTEAFWGKGSKCNNICGYSCSFGPTTLSDIKEKNLDDYLRNSLSNFRMISARDENTKNILESFCDKVIPLTCDPVILYGYKDEIKNNKIRINKDYILLYSYDKNMNTNSEILMIRDIASFFDLPIYSIGFYHAWCDKNLNADPIELLGYFKNAKYVITDTFHGTVLSLITNSNFATFIRGNSNKLLNLLKEYNLETRVFTSDKECKEILEKEIDYSDVNLCMDKYREESFKYLESILEI